MKTCWVCKQSKPLGEFYKRRAAADGYCDQCKPCGNARVAEWRAKNLGRARANAAARARKRRRGESTARKVSTKKYRVEPGDYDRMNYEQGGRCALCGKVPAYKLAVDHDHETGRVRALLCYGCNSGLGFFKESPGLLRLAANYVESHKPDGVLALAKDLAEMER